MQRLACILAPNGRGHSQALLRGERHALSALDDAWVFDVTSTLNEQQLLAACTSSASNDTGQ